MKYCRFAITAFLAAVLLPAYAQEQPVTPKEIQDTWVTKILIGTTANGAPATLKLEPDGTASVTAGSINDMGTWRLSDQGYCTTWKNIRSGQERCFTVRRVGTKMTVFNPDGSVSGQFTEVR
jgi:hypothetical protein